MYSIILVKLSVVSVRQNLVTTVMLLPDVTVLISKNAPPQFSATANWNKTIHELFFLNQYLLRLLKIYESLEFDARSDHGEAQRDNIIHMENIIFSLYHQAHSRPWLALVSYCQKKYSKIACFRRSIKRGFIPLLLNLVIWRYSHSLTLFTHYINKWLKVFASPPRWNSNAHLWLEFFLFFAAIYFS